MLGVEWSSNSRPMHDVDLAVSNNCLIAVPEDFKASGEQTLASNEKLLVIGAINQNQPSTSYQVRGNEFKVDFVTSLKHNEPPKEGSSYITELKTYAHKLRFIGFLLENTQKAVVLNKTVILVNVPDPARFALYKLAISGKRPAVDQINSRKDLAQAAQLIEVLLAARPGDLWRAIDSAKRYAEPKFAAMLLKMLDRLLQAIVPGFANME